MKFVTAAVLGLLVVTSSADAGSFGTHSRTPSLAPPRPPAPPAPPSSPGGGSGGFKPWKPTMRVDSPRGGVDAYPSPKKPKGYISPY